VCQSTQPSQSWEWAATLAAGVAVVLWLLHAGGEVSCLPGCSRTTDKSHGQTATVDRRVGQDGREPPGTSILARPAPAERTPCRGGCRAGPTPSCTGRATAAAAAAVEECPMLTHRPHRTLPQLLVDLSASRHPPRLTRKRHETRAGSIPNSCLRKWRARGGSLVTWRSAGPGRAISLDGSPRSTARSFGGAVLDFADVIVRLLAESSANVFGSYE
jgi:hypothetical protein